MPWWFEPNKLFFLLIQWFRYALAYKSPFRHEKIWVRRVKCNLVRVLATKPDSLTLIPVTHEERREPTLECYRLSHVHMLTCICANINAF